MKILRTLGLNENETKVYKALLRKPRITATEISDVSKVKRTTVYNCLENLKKKGLVSQRKKGKKTLYEGVNPTVLKHMVADQQEKWEKARTELEKELPQLKSLLSKAGQYPHVSAQDGFENMMHTKEEIFDALKEHKVGYTIGKTSQLYTLLGQDDYKKQFSQRRRQIKGTKLYHIVDENTFDKKRAQLAEKDYHEFRFLPQSYSSKTMILIIGESVFILKLSEPFLSIVIESTEIAEAMKFMWDMVWESAKR